MSVGYRSVLMLPTFIILPAWVGKLFVSWISHLGPPSESPYFSPLAWSMSFRRPFFGLYVIYARFVPAYCEYLSFLVVWWPAQCLLMRFLDINPFIIPRQVGGSPVVPGFCSQPSSAWWNPVCSRIYTRPYYSGRFYLCPFYWGSPLLYRGFLFSHFLDLLCRVLVSLCLDLR